MTRCDRCGSPFIRQDCTPADDCITYTCTACGWRYRVSDYQSMVARHIFGENPKDSELRASALFKREPETKSEAVLMMRDYESYISGLKKELDQALRVPMPPFPETRRKPTKKLRLLLC